ncbi:MAG: hypothetical protein K9N46_05485 [Candidatus Marinimicrobia bacterium]|nr:hypothetical protein [Candidatus Neomarinimicrobiota bacterium]MCF7880175.1 hypothetical protein [Candidatus Neomarinimicrobiota bacterium]
MKYGKSPLFNDTLEVKDVAIGFYRNSFIKAIPPEFNKEVFKIEIPEVL